MSNEIARLHADANAEYMARFHAKQDQIANDAATGRTKFTEHMAELCAIAQAEVLRLQRVLRDNTVVPERHAVSISVSTATKQNGQIKTTLLAVGSDKSLWLLEDFVPVITARGGPVDQSHK